MHLTSHCTYTTEVNPILNLSFGDDGYHPFTLTLGIVYGIGFTTLYAMLY
jgi:hypothetical protein